MARTKKLSRVDLYRAVKHQVHEHGAESGYSIRQLWDIINDEKADHHKFWLNVVITDYMEEVLGIPAPSPRYYDLDFDMNK
jgi:hypothetical protein